MFSLRQALYSRRLYSRSFFEKLIHDMRDAGFEHIRIKLPHNIVGAEKAEISLDEFLDRDRNYASLILVAQSPEREETIKVLFVNISHETFFMDDTFPSGHSVSPAIYVKSKDPARAYSLTKFFVHYLKGGTPSPSLRETILYLACTLAGVAEILVFLKQRSGLLGTWRQSLWPIDLVICLIAVISCFAYARKPSGLYINAKPQSGVLLLASRALRGELRDNPLVTVIVSVIASVLTAIILQLMGLL